MHSGGETRLAAQCPGARLEIQGELRSNYGRKAIPLLYGSEFSSRLSLEHMGTFAEAE